MLLVFLSVVNGEGFLLLTSEVGVTVLYLDVWTHDKFHELEEGLEPNA